MKNKFLLILVFLFCITNTIIAQTKLSYNAELLDKIKAEKNNSKVFVGNLSKKESITIYNNLALFASLDSQSKVKLIKSTVNCLSNKMNLNKNETKLIEKLALEKNFNIGMPPSIKFSSKEAELLFSDLAKVKKEIISNKQPSAYGLFTDIVCWLDDAWKRRREIVVEIAEFIDKIFYKNSNSTSSSDSFMLNENGKDCQGFPRDDFSF